MAGAVTTVIDQVIANPGSVITLLSENLPKASNFYINYFILFGLSAFAGTLLNIGGFITVVLLGRILPGKTPRKIFQKLTHLTAPKWGSEFPKWVNLGVIALSYSCIAPLVLGFSAIGLSLIYLAFRYNFLYTYEVDIDTRGMAYQRALQQLTTGVYLSELCLIGLFAIAVADQRAAVGPLAIEIVLLVITILFHLTYRRSLKHHEARVAYFDPIPTPHGGNLEKGSSSDSAGKPYTDKSDNLPAAVAPKPSKLPAFVQKLINPEKSNVANLGASLEAYYHKPSEPLPHDIAKRAYFNPAVTSATPVLWIVRDEMGISSQEVRESQKAVPGLVITDEQAGFNEKGKVHWDGVETGRAREAPVYEEKIVY